MVNIYTTQFFSRCPNNGIRIKYTLRIETENVLHVEAIVDSVERIGNEYHENIADALLDEFGGAQTLMADHHGVAIETKRSK